MSQQRKMGKILLKPKIGSVSSQVTWIPTVFTTEKNSTQALANLAAFIDSSQPVTKTSTPKLRKGMYIFNDNVTAKYISHDFSFVQFYFAIKNRTETSTCQTPQCLIDVCRTI